MPVRRPIRATVPVRVLVVDDEHLVRAGIELLLADRPDLQVVGWASDGYEAMAAVRRLSPDVVLMDVRMPEMDGVEATRRIVAEHGDSTAVVMLTTYRADEAVAAALRAGATGFVLKDCAPDELVAAVWAVAGGQGWLDPAVTRALLQDFSRRPDPGLPTPEEMGGLTGREREVLRLVALGLSNVEIADVLVVAESTVKTHYSRILMKLGLRDRAQAVSAAYRTGLVDPGDVPPTAP